MKRLNRPKLPDIKLVISQRLQLQSTVQALESFGVKNVNQALNKEFLKQVVNWGQFKKEQFLSILGGPANLKRTERLVAEIIK